MTNRDRESVRCMVRGRELRKAEDGTDHALHLRLLSTAVSADGVLHRRGRVLSAGDTRVSAGHEHGAARLSDGERGAGVDADEGLFEDDSLGPLLRDELCDGVVDAFQAELGALAGGRLPPAVVDGPQAPSVYSDNAVTARCRTRIDSENLHVARLRGGPDVPS